MRDVNSTWADCDVLIYNVCISAGISFDLDRFDVLFGNIKQQQNIDVQTVAQMLYRVRRLSSNTMHIYMRRSSAQWYPETQDDVHRALNQGLLQQFAPKKRLESERVSRSEWRWQENFRFRAYIDHCAYMNRCRNRYFEEYVKLFPGANIELVFGDAVVGHESKKRADTGMVDRQVAAEVLSAERVPLDTRALTTLQARGQKKELLINTFGIKEEQLTVELIQSYSKSDVLDVYRALQLECEVPLADCARVNQILIPMEIAQGATPNDIAVQRRREAANTILMALGVNTNHCVLAAVGQLITRSQMESAVAVFQAMPNVFMDPTLFPRIKYSATDSCDLDKWIGRIRAVIRVVGLSTASVDPKSHREAEVWRLCKSKAGALFELTIDQETKRLKQVRPIIITDIKKESL